MYEEQWTVGSTLSVAWERFKTHAAAVLISMIVAGGVIFVVQMVGNVFQQAPTFLGQADVDETVVLVLVILIQLVFGFVNWFVQTWFGLGMVKIFLKTARNQEPSVGDLFTVGPFFLAALLAGLLAGLAQAVGLLLLIVPGIILALGLMLHKYAIVDQDLGPIECLKESWRLTDNEKFDLFLWGLAVMGINIAGFCCCIVGLLVTVPVTQIGTAYIYDNMLRRKGNASGEDYDPDNIHGDGSGYSDASYDRPAPSSRSSSSGDAPLMGKD